MRVTSVIFVKILVFYSCACFSQDNPPLPQEVPNFPTRVFGSIRRKTAVLDEQLTRQTEKYLERMARREERIREKLAKLDPASAGYLFNNSTQQYAALAQKMEHDTGSRSMAVSGEYQPHVDSLKGSLAFLQENPSLLSSRTLPQLQSSLRQLQQFQAKMQDADEVKAFVRERKERIRQYLSQYTNLPGGIAKECQGMNRDLYMYSDQVRAYREMLNDPSRLEQKALTLLDRLPAFQRFMKANGQLAGLFGVPDNYGSPEALAGLQTRDQVTQLIQAQVASGGANGMAALQTNLQDAQAQLNGFKDKLSRLGGGSGDMDMPDLKVNPMKTRTLFQRMELGANFQTSRTNSAFPTVVDLGLSIGYKLTPSSSAGVGVSYKLGCGNGINHIAFSSNGLGLRSFIDIKIKGSLSATGGLEYNHQTPFTSFQKLRQMSFWTRSGLIGVTKTVSVNNRMFKKTKISLLWDFLSYQQIPRQQPILFRIQYLFK